MNQPGIGEHGISDSVLAERILIVDDCTLFRDNLVNAFVLNSLPEPAVAWDLPSLISAIDDSGLRIVLVNMATRGSQLLLRAAMDMNTNLRLITLGTSVDDDGEIVACAEAGVVGFHLRSDTFDDLLNLIHDVAVGQPSFPPTVSAILLRRLSALASQPLPVERELALTAREIQVLRMIELGHSNRDIAARLDIAVHTVKNHVHNVLTKLGVGTRAEAVEVVRNVRTDRGFTRRN